MRTMGKFVPHDYQKYAIDRIISDSALGLFLDMGLGKTVITLSAVMQLKYDQFLISKCLVIAPKKVAEATWTNETAKWDHLRGLRVVRVLGSATERMRALAGGADVYVINRENVPWLVKYLQNAWCFDMVVIDELSSFKNRNSKRFKALKLVKPHIKRLVGLTGTPSPNGLEDLWAQVYLLDEGKRLGKTLTAYRDVYFRPDKRSRDQIYSYKPDEGAAEAIKEKISDICVSMTAKDYLTMPAFTVDDMPIVLSAPARRAYDKMERDMLIEVDENTIDAASAAALTTKLLQIAGGAVYGEDGVAEIHTDKIDAFGELIEQLCGEHALVFYAYRHDIERITGECERQGLRCGELKTEADIARWNGGELDILLAHPASAAYGLNLQSGGHHIIWYGLTWSLELYQQANARLWRQGQDKGVIVHRLIVQNSADENAAEALEGKRGTQDAVMNALKARIEKVRGGK